MEQSLVSFLREKFKTVSIGSIIRLELEGWGYWSCKNLPGVIGFFLRNVIVSIFIKRKKGMIWLQPEINLVHIGNMEIGRNVGINSGSYLNAIGGLKMGDYVLIGSNVTISSGIHPIEGIEPSIYERPVIPKEIVIEEGVWIAAGAVILPGVTLRKGTVVGANSVVTKSTDPYAVVVGAPARVVKYRNANS